MTGDQARYVEAPAHYRQRDDDPPAVFLAGGITGCPNWQAEAATLAGERCVVLNPRRAVFDPADPGLVAEQVAWEHQHLHHVPRLLTLFWFPASDPAVTVQPIALFELGAVLQLCSLDRPLLVGADAGYPRRNDLVLQLRHAAPELTVHDSLTDVLHEALAMVNPEYGFLTGSW